MVRRCLDVVLVLLLFSNGIDTYAAVYKWRDSDGKVHYSEHAQPGQPGEPLAVPNATLPKAAVIKPTLREPTKAPVPQGKLAPTLPAERQEALCKQAREEYARLDSTPRVFRMEADGNRVRLSEEERQAELAHEQESIAKYCH